jgi:ribosomal protein S18 acetylase RimI-like enzyme
MRQNKTVFSLRPASLSDVEALAGLVTELGYPTSLEEMRVRLQAVLEDADYDTFVARVGERVVGFVGTRLGPVYEANGLQGQIMALVVAEGYRRSGIGRSLMRAALENLEVRGATSTIVNTGNQRAGAHAFYEALGFVFTGRRYRKSKPTDGSGL